MKNPFKFQRYTSVSCRDRTKPIVPLAPIASWHNGIVPQDGQYVPGEVINALFDYENAMEQKSMVVTELGMDQRVYIVKRNPEHGKYVAVPYTVREIRITRSDRRNYEIYVTYCEEEEGYFARTRHCFQGESLHEDFNICKTKEDAESRAWALNKSEELQS